MVGGGWAVVGDWFGLLAVVVAGTGLPLVRWAARWGVHGHAFATPRISVGGGMVLFGLGQGWAQSHKSVTPAVGDHADTELAVHLTTSASHAASGGARLRIS